jgi:hypothetical protein
MKIKLKDRCECSSRDVIFIDHERVYCTKCVPEEILTQPPHKKTGSKKVMVTNN